MEDFHYPMSCPFCGSFPVLATIGNKGQCAMRCQGCGASGPAKYMPGDAARAWDETRPRRRMTDRDLRGPEDDPKPRPNPVKPKLPELV